MKRKAPSPALPLHDYRPALKGALSWLGSRYLLAEPTRPLVERLKSFSTEKRRWHPAAAAESSARGE